MADEVVAHRADRIDRVARLLAQEPHALGPLGRPAALLEAGPTRLRPILMTTVAMVFGMLPTALSLGRGGEFRAPVATAIVGGLILSTMLTLLVIPCVYTYFDDFSRFVARVVFRRRLQEEPAAPPPHEPATVD